MKFFERFSGQFADLPQLLLLRLDKNFYSMAREFGPATTTTSGYTLLADDQVSSLQADATAAALTVYLPIQPVGNRRRTVIKTDSSGNAVTVNGNGALINGAATYSLAAQYKSVTVEPTGSGWLVVAST